MKNKGPASSLPFANTMGDSFDLMKKMWGMTGLPGIPNPANLAAMAVRLPQQLPSMVAPTLDVNELDKRIADLRAVEQWLELNSSMLRTTIQTLEVQRATIATLKGISGAMLGPLTRPGPKVEAGALAPTAFAMPQASAPAEPPVTARKGGRRRRKPKSVQPPTVADAPLNPTAWWNTLQDQFTKIAATAASTAALPAAKKAGKATATRRSSKTGKAS
jgi:hypothetical protein